MPERTDWPGFAAYLLSVGRGDVCGKCPDFPFVEWTYGCRLPHNHTGPHDWDRVDTHPTKEGQ